jgi:PLP dependent protein
VVADARRDEIAANLAQVRARLASAARAAGRSASEITLVAVTKMYPAEDVIRLADLGVEDIGENRDQEASAKAEIVGHRVRWHFIGQLQRNKCKSVVRYADMVHSVDGVRLAETLAAAAAAHREQPLDVLVQVSIDGDEARGGAITDGTGDAGLGRVLEAVAAAPALRLRGLMAVAPIDWEPRRAFARLAEIAAATRATYPAATLLSAGMSGDVEEAIEHGATHVRLGTALLGNRARLM